MRSDAIETVQAIKAAGINVGLIVLIGLGGDRFAAGHVADTIEVLNQMPLDRRRLVVLQRSGRRAGHTVSAAGRSSTTFAP